RPRMLELAQLRMQCGQEVQAAQCYEAFAQAGMSYGPSFQALQKVKLGQDASGQPLVLGELSLPKQVGDDRFVLHPSMMDGALQASIGLLLGTERTEPKTMLPFALERLQV